MKFFFHSFLAAWNFLIFGDIAVWSFRKRIRYDFVQCSSIVSLIIEAVGMASFVVLLCLGLFSFVQLKINTNVFSVAYLSGSLFLSKSMTAIASDA